MTEILVEYPYVAPYSCEFYVSSGKTSCEVSLVHNLGNASDAKKRKVCKERLQEIIDALIKIQAMDLVALEQRTERG